MYLSSGEFPRDRSDSRIQSVLYLRSVCSQNPFIYSVCNVPRVFLVLHDEITTLYLKDRRRMQTVRKSMKIRLNTF